MVNSSKNKSNQKSMDKILIFKLFQTFISFYLEVDSNYLRFLGQGISFTINRLLVIYHHKSTYRLQSFK